MDPDLSNYDYWDDLIIGMAPGASGEREFAACNAMHRIVISYKNQILVCGLFTASKLKIER